jgi:hypothetical protein
VEGATGSTFVAASEDEGNTLVCVVTASDNVETSTASAGVKIALTGQPEHARKRRVHGEKGACS